MERSGMRDSPSRISLPPTRSALPPTRSRASAYALRASADSNPSVARAASEGGSLHPGYALAMARSLLRQFALVVLVVELRVHPVLRAVAPERLGVFLGDEGVLHPVRDRRATLGEVHAGVVDVLLARRTGFAPRIVRAEPGGEPQRLLGGAEVLVEPARAAGCRRHHADRLVVDPLDLVLLAVLPRRDAEAFRPSVSVALALDADQHRGRGVGMRLGVAAVLMLADPQIEGVAGHERLDPAEAGGAAVVEGQIAVVDVGHEVGAPHGEPAHWVGLDVVLVLVEVVSAAEAVAELKWAIKDRAHIVDQVHQIRRRGAAEQQCRGRARIDDAVPGVDGDREQRTLLPLEHVLLAVLVEPHLGRAAALDHVVDFLVEVLLGVERAGARHLDDVTAPFPLGAVELDVGAAPAKAFPRGERQILHLAHADVAEDRNALRFHEQVVRRLRPTELAEARAPAGGRLVPVAAWDIMHGGFSLNSRRVF